MRQRAFTIVEMIMIFFAIVIIAAVVIPLNLTDADQAKRVAKWHKVYKELQYSFNLIILNDGSILGEKPDELTQGEIFDRISPYLDIADADKQPDFHKYKYKYRNKTYIRKSSRYYFDDFFLMNGDIIGSLKKNRERLDTNSLPYAYMFVDINGLEEPNRVGLDIFFINIYNDRISAYGEGYPLPDLKAGCSKIGKGLFCSKYYLVGSNL